MSESLESRLQDLLGTQFLLGRQLSGGGMSRLFVANEPSLKRDVVVKILPPDLVTSTSLLRFRREIELTAQLQHPHILPIITTGGAGELLYYVAPFIAGESLSDRLRKGTPLSFDAALQLSTELLGAIAFAHGRGVVHRDVKPGNILLAEGHAILADFGIARALAGADDETVTQSGTIVGTPVYLAPELPRDEAADLYAVAVVVYEMITGDVPPRERTPDRVAAAIVSAAPAAARRRARKLGRVLGLALSADPAERYQTARELHDAFAGAASAPSVSREMVGVVAAIVLIVVASGAWIGMRNASRHALSPEGTMIAVMPFTAVGGDSIIATGDTVAVRISDALQQWSGLRLVAPARLREELGVTATLPNVRAVRAARAAGADRVVVGSVGRAGSSLQVTASIIDAARGTTIRTRVATIGGAAPAMIQQVRALANALLRDSTELPWRDATDKRRVSLAGWIAFDSAESALQDWRLGAAQRYFTAAVAADPENIRAQLQLAEILRWSREANVAIGTLERSAAARAEAGRARLDPYAALLATGARALSESRFSDACASFLAATKARPGAFDGWVGLAECEYADDGVVPDARSPTKFAFRSSYWSAASNYERALATLSSSRPAFVHLRLQRVLATEPNHLRLGRAPDGRIFAAQVERFGDSTGYWPVDVAASHGVAPGAAKSTAAALELARDRLRPVIIAWVSSDPGSGEAHYALSRLLESAGNIDVASGDGFTALDEMRRARALTGDSTLADLMRANIRLYVKTARWGDARRLADSALAQWPTPNDYVAERLIGPAALVGRTTRTAALLRQMSATPSRGMRDPGGKPLELPPALLEARAEFVARAATGACDESVRAAPAKISDLATAFYGASKRPPWLDGLLLSDPVLMALPCLGAAATAQLGPSRSEIISIAQAFAARDGGARERLRAFNRTRDDAPGETQSMDVVFEGAWLNAAAGDSVAALHALDRALTALPAMFEAVINRENIAGAIPRAMRLAAQLGAARHVAGSDRWAAAADSLTSRER